MSDVLLGERKSWGVSGALFLGALAFIGPQFLMFGLAPFVAAVAPTENLLNFALNATYEALVILLIVAFVRGYGMKLKDIGLGAFRRSFVPKALLGFGVYFLLTVATMLIADLIIHINDTPQELGFAAPSSLELIFVFIGLVVLAPLAEEILFRGFVYKGLRSKLSFGWAAVLVSALFALVHGQLNVGLDVFALSLVLCYLREHTGSLWPAIMLHALKNGVAFFILFIYTGPK